MGQSGRGRGSVSGAVAGPGAAGGGRIPRPASGTVHGRNLPCAAGAALLRWGLVVLEPHDHNAAGSLPFGHPRGQGSDGRPRRCRCKWCWCSYYWYSFWGEPRRRMLTLSPSGHQSPLWRWLRPVALWLTPPTGGRAGKQRHRRASGHASASSSFSTFSSSSQPLPVGRGTRTCAVPLSGALLLHLPLLHGCRVRLLDPARGVARNSSAVCDCCQHLHCCC